MLEIRGLGIVRTSHIREIALKMAIRLTIPETIERMPDFDKSELEILGCKIPVIHLAAFAVSTAAQVRAATLFLSASSKSW
jgi:hypothetical protein